MLSINDLDIDVETAEDQAEAALEEIPTADIVMVLGQLDPFEMVDGDPRWTADQISAIEKSRDVLKTWEDES